MDCRLFLAAMLMVACSPIAYGQNGSVNILRPSEISLRGEWYETLRDPYIRQYDEDWQYGAAMGLKTDIISGDAWRLYYDAELKFRATGSQVRQGGLTYQTGLKLPISSGATLDLFRYHESLHCLECNSRLDIAATRSDSDMPQTGDSTSRHYPLNDSYGVELRWKLN